ncbi:MAG TPA: amidohydrolase [Thermoanaerobaculia bacterium]|nr:amidohydrolase [Thermoanaerobaculia bacterium]
MIPDSEAAVARLAGVLSAILVASGAFAATPATPAAPAPPAPPATLIVLAAGGWTGDPARPRAAGVAVRGEEILAVGTREEVMAHRGTQTRLLELDGFLLPGFIDNHTHFDRAGALLAGVNLLDVADAEGLRRRVAEARERLPRGAWLLGGDWGAYEAWGRGSTGAAPTAEPKPAEQAERPEPGDPAQPFTPHRDLIDPLTRDTPALLSRWDGSLWLANAAALEAAGVTCAWEGAECDADGRLTGRLSPAAARRVREVVPDKTLEQRLVEARAALADLRRHGVTGIHDITPAAQLRVFQELERRGELTVRVDARPTLDRWQQLAALGIGHGFGSERLRIGGLKGFVDGIMGNSSARFYEPYRTTGERGQWRDMMRPEGNLLRLLRGADAAGHWPHVHAIGDEAIDTLLDLYEQAMADAPPRERRWRLIHAQVLRGPEVAARMARLGVVAEVQPYHAIDDMRWMEERIGERSRWAYAFRTLHQAGVRLSFGSDWPGTNASWYPSDPLLGIYAAVTRQTLEGAPAGGWFPQERVDLETALFAYTVNNAWAAGEEGRKGSLTPGKLADLVVLDRDPFAVAPEKLKDLRVRLTVLGGEVVWEAPL